MFLHLLLTADRKAGGEMQLAAVRLQEGAVSGSWWGHVRHTWRRGDLLRRQRWEEKLKPAGRGGAPSGFCPAERFSLPQGESLSASWCGSGIWPACGFPTTAWREVASSKWRSETKRKKRKPRGCWLQYMSECVRATVLIWSEDAALNRFSLGQIPEGVHQRGASWLDHHQDRALQAFGLKRRLCLNWAGRLDLSATWSRTIIISNSIHQWSVFFSSGTQPTRKEVLDLMSVL